MSASLEELKQLWDRHLDGHTSRAEDRHIRKLLTRPDMAEAFGLWMGQSASAEPQEALDEQAWVRLDTRVTRAFSAFKRALPQTVLAASLAAGVLGVLLYSWLGVPQVGSSFNLQQGFSNAESSRLDEEVLNIKVVGDLPARPRIKVPGLASREPIGPPPVEASRFAGMQWTKTALRFSVERLSSGPAEILIGRSDGKTVRHLYNGSLAAGRWTFEWDGRADNKLRVAPGRYRVEVKSGKMVQGEDVEVEYHAK